MHIIMCHWTMPVHTGPRWRILSTLECIVHTMHQFSSATRGHPQHRVYIPGNMQHCRKNLHTETARAAEGGQWGQQRVVSEGDRGWSVRATEGGEWGQQRVDSEGNRGWTARATEGGQWGWQTRSIADRQTHCSNNNCSVLCYAVALNKMKLTYCKPCWLSENNR